jgi:hypothetical protein
VLDRLTRDDAMARCARDLGRVIYVDDYCGFIFYSDSPSGSVNVSPTLPQR